MLYVFPGAIKMALNRPSDSKRDSLASRVELESLKSRQRTVLLGSMLVTIHKRKHGGSESLRRAGS